MEDYLSGNDLSWQECHSPAPFWRPVPAPPPDEGRRRLDLIARMLTRGADESVAELAVSEGMTRQWLYQLVERAADALRPRPPGPPTGWREEDRLREENRRLHAEVQRLQGALAQSEAALAERVEVTERQRDRFELACFAQNVSLRGTQELMEVAWGAAPGSDGAAGAHEGAGAGGAKAAG